MSLPYAKLVEYYAKIEATTKRLEMTDLLVCMFKETPPEDIRAVCYLTLGRIGPEYMGLETGLADRNIIKAISLAYAASERDVDRLYKEKGDLGEVAAEFSAKKGRRVSLVGFFEEVEPLTVREVYDRLVMICRYSGEGAIQRKINTFAGLLSRASPNEARYLVRTVLGKLRLGVADMTLLDALAEVFGLGREQRSVIERAYNLCSDIGLVAETLAKEGVEGVKRISVQIGVPIRVMLAQRLSSVEEIFKKLGKPVAAEYKYDGERMQIHKHGDEVTIFSRRQENITYQYPDVVKYVRNYVKATDAIVEAECVAINPDTGEMRPFQELMHRRRKYGIEEAIREYPVKLFFFDAIFIDGQLLIDKPYPERRKVLEQIIEESEHTCLAQAIVTDDPKELEAFFEQAVSEGCEGLVVKSVRPDSVYQAGARGWLWIKYKRDYKSELQDTIDVVVVGAFYGMGRRAGTYGALLVATYNPDKEMFETLCKVGTGFTDEDLKRLPEWLDPYKIPHRHARVFSKMNADVWFEPARVIEITGAEITLSPVHTCAYGVVREGVGLAVRFPRFTGRYREDKGPQDATTSQEIVEMYRRQLKKIA
ncbi:ATP-dependent DNA ligase [archaeon]|nr:ATP-dependent DNA ligase [archaeon]